MNLMLAEPHPSGIGTVAELWRYPVKSLRGEQIRSLTFDVAGVAGDRRFAFVSSGAPVGKPLLTGRERARMLLYAAEGEGDSITLTTPEGERLRLLDAATLPTIERALGEGHQLRLRRSEAPLTDCRPVALLSLQTVAQVEHEFNAPVDARRFRANILLDLPGTNGFAEDALVGRTIRIGSAATLRITERDPRCRIIILDPKTAEPDPRLIKLIDRLHEGRLGIYGSVLTPGTIHIGDTVMPV